MNFFRNVLFFSSTSPSCTFGRQNISVPKGGGTWRKIIEPLDWFVSLTINSVTFLFFTENANKTIEIFIKTFSRPTISSKGSASGFQLSYAGIHGASRWCLGSLSPGPEVTTFTEVSRHYQTRSDKRSGDMSLAFIPQQLIRSHSQSHISPHTSVLPPPSGFTGCSGLGRMFFNALISCSSFLCWPEGRSASLLGLSFCQVADSELHLEQFLT